MNQSCAEFLRYEETDIDEPSVLEYQKEINETPENRATSLEILRKDLKNLKDLEPCLDEEFLLRFLRVSKFDTIKAFQRVSNYYKKFDDVVETYKKISFSLQKAQSLRHIWISPYRCENNSFLILANCAIDYKKFSFAERFYLEILFMHELIENPINQICGGTYVFDYEGFDIHGYIAYSPGWIRMFLDFLVNIFPCRLKALHIVNAPSFFLPIWKIAYPFLPKKVQTRFFLHAKSDGWRNLHASISPDILPEKYGGKLKQSELISCLENLEELEEKFYKIFQFGNIKTKKCRQALKVFS